jgi:antitoxin (DNA-binding transcriptional repressor) of toxin-antitoxin stability system
MDTVKISQVKSTLSRLVDAIEQGREREIVITRGGRPVAKLVPLGSGPVGKRVGVAKGTFEVPDSIDAHNEVIAKLFSAGSNT